MEMDQTHPEEADQQHHQAGIEMEPQGKRKRGRPRNTWRRDLEADTKKTGYSWGHLERTAQDRGLWRSVVRGLCSGGSDGHE